MSLSLSICHSHTCPVSRSPCQCHCHTVTMSLSSWTVADPLTNTYPHIHCHTHTLALLLWLSHCNSQTVTVTLLLSHFGAGYHISVTMHDSKGFRTWAGKETWLNKTFFYFPVSIFLSVLIPTFPGDNRWPPAPTSLTHSVYSWNNAPLVTDTQVVKVLFLSCVVMLNCFLCFTSKNSWNQLRLKCVRTCWDIIWMKQLYFYFVSCSGSIFGVGIV